MAQDYNVTLSAAGTVQLPVMSAHADRAAISLHAPSTVGGHDEGRTAERSGPRRWTPTKGVVPN